MSASGPFREERDGAADADARPQWHAPSEGKGLSAPRACLSAARVSPPLQGCVGGWLAGREGRVGGWLAGRGRRQVGWTERFRRAWSGRKGKGRGRRGKQRSQVTDWLCTRLCACGCVLCASARLWCRRAEGAACRQQQAGERAARTKRRQRRLETWACDKKQRGGGGEEEESGEGTSYRCARTLLASGSSRGEPAGETCLARSARAPGEGVAARDCEGKSCFAACLPPSLGIPSGEGAAPAV